MHLLSSYPRLETGRGGFPGLRWRGGQGARCEAEVEKFASIAIIYNLITLAISKNLKCLYQKPCFPLKVFLARRSEGICIATLFRLNKINTIFTA
jgi:hypothetical protein